MSSVKVTPQTTLIRNGRGLSKAWKLQKTQRDIYSGGKAAIIPNENLLACLCDSDIVLADLDTGQVSRVIACGEGEGKEQLISFALPPGHRSIATASRNLMIRFWDRDDCRCLRGFKAHETPVLDMEYDSTGTLLATGSADRTVKVWDVPGIFCTHNFRGHEAIVTMVRFHPVPARELLFSCSEDCTLRLWSLATSACTNVLRQHMSTVTGLVISRDGHTLVSAGRDHLLCFWKMEEGDEGELLQSTPVYEAVEGLLMLEGDEKERDEGAMSVGPKKGRQRSRNGTFVLAGEKGRVRVFEYASKADEFATGLTVSCVAEQDEEQRCRQGYAGLIASEARGIVIALTIDRQMWWLQVAHRQVKKAHVLVGQQEEIIDVKYRNEGEVFVASSSPEIRLWDLGRLKCVAVLGEGGEGHRDTVLALDVTSDGEWLLSGGKDKRVCLWKGKGGVWTCVARWEGHTDGVTAVAVGRKARYEPGGGGIVCWSAGGEKVLKRWVYTGEHGAGGPGMSIVGHEKDINALAVAPNDSMLASASQDKTVKLWGTGPELKSLGVLKGHRRGVWSVQFSPLDRLVVTGSADRTIKVWGLANYMCLKTLEGHEGSVLRATFLLSGLQVLSAGSDGLMKVWSLRSQECLGTFDGHRDKVWALAMSPSGQQAVTGGADAVLQVWRDVTAEEEEEGVREAERLLEKEQALMNAVRRKDYAQAIRLALDLGRPLRLFRILQEISEIHSTGQMTIRSLIAELSGAQIAQVLGYCREWNTNAKQASVAQQLLRTLLCLVSHEQLKECCASQPGLLEGLLAYSQRHLSRADRLLQASFLVDYTLSNMDMLFPSEDIHDSPSTAITHNLPVSESKPTLHLPDGNADCSSRHLSHVSSDRLELSNISEQLNGLDEVGIASDQDREAPAMPVNGHGYHTQVSTFSKTRSQSNEAGFNMQNGKARRRVVEQAKTSHIREGQSVLALGAVLPKPGKAAEKNGLRSQVTECAERHARSDGSVRRRKKRRR